MKKSVFLMLLLCAGMNVLFAQLTTPQLYSPSNNSTNMDVSQRLCVTKVSGANYYEIELDTTSNFNSPLKQTLNASSYNSSYSYYYTSVSNLLYGTKYYWRARCAHAADTTGWSAVWNFTTQFTLTTAPTLISPVDGATNVDAQNVTLTWDALANATSYQYQVSTTSDFSNLAASGTTANPYVFMVLPGNATYYWRVRGSDGLGFSPWSVIWHFSAIINCDDPVYTYQYATDCHSYTWQGETYTETGVYYDTLSTLLGCDSIVVLNLTITGPSYGTDVQTACNSYTWIDGNTYTTNNNTATYTLEGGASNGCDSIVTLDLTVNHPVENEADVTACDEYEWNGETLTASGDYTATFTAANGCDSTVTLTLTIEPCDTNGINENGIVDITLYPNPTTGMVNVQFTTNNEQWENAEIQVLDVYGRLLQTVETCHGASLQIDLSQYATGIYLVRWVNGGKVMVVRKVVKE